MKRIIDRLFIGTISDHDAEEFAIVCACRTPCWVKAIEAKHNLPTVPPTHEDSVCLTEENRLILNMSDGPLPTFRVETFNNFLAFAIKNWEAGKSILVHGVRGESRPNALVMVFRAKILGDIPNHSYLSAWEASRRPKIGEGLTKWFEKKWHDLPQRLVAHIEGATPKEAEKPKMDATTQESVDLLEAYKNVSVQTANQLIKYSPLVHFAACARIVDKSNALTPRTAANQPSLFQYKACQAYEWLVANNQPVRLLLGPKPRQSYGSTITAEICQHHSRRFKYPGMVIGDESSRTDLLWKMFNDMVKNDRWAGWDTVHESNQERAVFRYLEDGKERTFDWLRDTASDDMAGSSGTRQILWLSEAGRYGKEGKVTDSQVISNAMASVPAGPGSLVIMESVSGGPSGSFYEICRGAVTLEQRMQGEYGNGWVKVFCAWHEVPDYKTARSPETEALFTDPLDDAERIGVQRYGWTAEQLAWRRNTIASVFQGNEALFHREFPSSEEEAFHAGGTPRFCQKGLAKIESMALVGHATAKRAVIEKFRNGVHVLETENPWLWEREAPMVKCRYIVFGDFMTGEQSKGSRVRDEHAVGVWRDTYMDPSGKIHPIRLAAAIYVPKGCRWDEDIIADRVHLLSQYYGNCVIGLEVNEALGVLATLKKAGANIWQRKKDDDVVPGQTLMIPGWKTTPQTRPMLINETARLIREQQIQIEFEPMARQLRIFQQYPDGSCAAPPGEHDDWVLGGGIGLKLLPFATEYALPAPIQPHSPYMVPRTPEEEAGGKYGTHAFG